MALIAGVDGCKGGWICIEREIGSRRTTARVLSTEEMARVARAVDVLAIDIPIGLSDAGPRACDVAARKLLAPTRSSSVFPAPVRAALAAQTWEQACEFSLAAGGKKLSKQSFGILPRIRAVDELLRRDPDLQSRFREVHPEVSFSVWNGGRPMRWSKKTAPGRAERTALVQAAYGSGLEHARTQVPRGLAGADDILDAFAALWSAERILEGRATTLPLHPPRDRYHLPMEIVA